MKQTFTSQDSSGFLDLFYPIGSVYSSTVATSPDTLFGGQWTQIQDKFLLGDGSDFSVGESGGEATHAITANEMPAHVHVVGEHSHSLNEHTHQFKEYYSTTTGGSAATTGSTTISFSNGYMSATAHGGPYARVKSVSTAWTATRRQYHQGFHSASSARTTKTKLSGSQEHTHTLDSHTHAVTNTSTSRTSSAATGSTADSAAFNSGGAGSGTPKENMPPYLAVYMWERVA